VQQDVGGLAGPLGSVLNSLCKRGT
jgi:hypothetical protein